MSGNIKITENKKVGDSTGTENPEDCGAKQNRSIVCGTVSIHTGGKVCRYFYGRDDQSKKALCYLGE